MEGPPLGPGGEDITWPDQVAPRGRKASSTRKIKPQTSCVTTTPFSKRRFLTVEHCLTTTLWSNSETSLAMAQSWGYINQRRV